MTKAVAYARVSSEEQEREGYSIEAQLGLMRDYARRHSIKIVKEFREAVSAKQQGREQFRAMMAYLTANPGVELIVEKVDRYTRNWDDAAWRPKAIDDRHVVAHFAKEGFNLSEKSKSHDHLMFDIHVAFARQYVRKLGEEASKGMGQKAREGVWPSSAPLGYVNTTDGYRKVIAPVLVKAPIVARVFEGFVQDRPSIEGATKLCMELGLTSSRARPLAKSSVHRLLRNPIYKGNVLWKGEEFEGVHVPLVDAHLWREAQELLDGRGKSPSGYGIEGFAFRGLLACGSCGRTMTPERKRGRHGRGNYVYYACKNRGCAERLSAREEQLVELGALALDEVRLPKRVCKIVRSLLDDSLASEQEFKAKEIERLRKKGDRARLRLRRIYEDRLDGVIDVPTYSSLKGEYEKEAQSAEARIAQHGRAESSYFDLGVSVLDLCQRMADIYRRTTPERQREILTSVMDRATFDGTRLVPAFKPVFEALVKLGRSNVELGEEGSHCPEWLAFLDSLRNAA